MHRHRLLLIDDDAGTRSAIGSIFSRMGWMVRLASTLREGIAWLEAGHEPCCLILDLGLPDGPGETILEAVREKRLRTHVAVCTGLDDRERIALVAKLNPNVLLLKPVKVADVWSGVCPLEVGRDQ
jgi:two-component system KDP operon response regulator KdpE